MLWLASSIKSLPRTVQSLAILPATCHLVETESCDRAVTRGFGRIRHGEGQEEKGRQEGQEVGGRKGRKEDPQGDRESRQAGRQPDRRGNCLCRAARGRGGGAQPDQGEI